MIRRGLGVLVFVRYSGEALSSETCGAESQSKQYIHTQKYITMTYEVPQSSQGTVDGLKITIFLR